MSVRVRVPWGAPLLEVCMRVIDIEYTPLERKLVQALMDVYEAIDEQDIDLTVEVAKRNRNAALEIMHPILIEHQHAVRK